MQCPKCGAEVDVPFALECPRCGVVFSKIASHAAEVAPHTNQPIQPRKANSSGSRALAWVIGSLIALAWLASWFSRARADAGWYHGPSGYVRGLAEHNSTHKPLLVYFYTDWCPHCRDLDRRVFSTTEFRSRFASLIKVKVNIDGGAREGELARKFYSGKYIPAVFLVDGTEPRSIPVYHDTGEFFAAVEGHYTNDSIESGSALLNRGKAVEAGEEFDRAARDKPNDPEPHYLKGVALVEQGRRVEAAFEFQTAVRIRPDAPSYDYLAWLALEKSEWSDALDYATKIIDLDPRYDNGRGYGLRAQAYWKLGKSLEAYRDADRACTLGDKTACNFKASMR